MALTLKKINSDGEICYSFDFLTTYSNIVWNWLFAVDYFIDSRNKFELIFVAKKPFIKRQIMSYFIIPTKGLINKKLLKTYW